MLNYSTKQGKIYKDYPLSANSKQNIFHTVDLFLSSGEKVGRHLLNCMRWKALLSSTVQ